MKLNKYSIFDMTEYNCSEYSRTFPPLQSLSVVQVGLLYKMACSNFLEPKTKTGIRIKNSDFKEIELDKNSHFTEMIQPLMDRIQA